VRLAAALLLVQAGCALLPARADEPLVDVASFNRTIVIDIRYATPDNFTHKTLYPAARCLLRESVAKRLALVQSDLAASGLGLKVWDCYRPLSVQRKLWELVPDPRYVADPKKGSRHNRGAAVDLTLIDRARGAELEMPTGFDDFSEKAHRDSSQASPEALRNRARLEEAMTARGFAGLPTEWWHFDASGWRAYPLLDAPLSGPPPRP
jgi:D-alanyl-D-alanine dipeptidase